MTDEEQLLAAASACRTEEAIERVSQWLGDYRQPPRSDIIAAVKSRYGVVYATLLASDIAILLAEMDRLRAIVGVE